MGSLLDVPDSERPIIILQGDEGPYPTRFAKDQQGFDWATATDEELVSQVRRANAMYLPGPEGAEPLRPDMTLVNTYPEIFRRYFGATVEDRPELNFASPEGPALRLTDITERLDGAEALVSP